MPRHDSLARLAPVGTLAGFAFTIAGTAAWCVLQLYRARAAKLVLSAPRRAAPRTAPRRALRSLRRRAAARL
jgi:hypothetical protein